MSFLKKEILCCIKNFPFIPIFVKLFKICVYLHFCVVSADTILIHLVTFKIGVYYG